MSWKCVKRVFCHHECNTYFVGQSFVESSQQCSSPCQEDAVFHNVGVKLWWSVFQCGEHCTLYTGHSLIQAVGNLLIADRDLHWQCRYAVWAMVNVVFWSLVAQVS